MKTLASAVAETKSALVAVPLETVVQSLPLDALEPNPLNPRKTFDETELKELAQSIGEVGVIVPLLVRLRKKPYFASQGEFEPGKVWYLACINCVGHMNLCRSFGAGTEQENKADAEKAAAEANGAADFEIIAGERRWRASRLAGKISVPCIVRELTDADAADTAFVDNAQRANVPAIEEAEAFGALLARHGTAAAVALKVGKDVAHVTKRLKLRTLGVFQVDALRQQLITVDHALLLARLGVEEQDEALKWCLDPSVGSRKPVDQQIKESLALRTRDGRHRSWEPESVIQLKEHIEQSTGRKLSRAPWDLDDKQLLPEAGCCTDCPQNTKANPALFEDLNITAATCSDGRCFELKRERFVQIALAHAGMPPGSAIRLSWKRTSTAPRMTTMAEDVAGGPTKGSIVINLKQVFKVGQWVEAKKGSCASIATGVTVDWSDDADRGYMGTGEKLKKPGQAIQVCVAVKCKAHRKEWEKPKSENSNSAPQESEAERNANREKVRLAALAETKFRVRLAGEAIDKVTKLPEALLRRMLIGQLPDGSELECANAVLPGVIKLLETAKLDSIDFARAVALASINGRHLEVWAAWEPKQYRKEFIEDLGRLGYDASKAWNKPPAEKAPAPAVGLKNKVAEKALVEKVAAMAKKPAAKKAAAVKAAPVKNPLSAAKRKAIAAAVRKGLKRPQKKAVKR